MWLKALSAFEVRNFGYAISLLQSVVTEEPLFLDGRRLLRRAAFENTKGKKGFFGGMSKPSLTGFKSGGMVKKDPLAAMAEAEKILETDPGSDAGNMLLFDAAMALEHTEIASFALETRRQANPKDTKILHHLARHYYDIGLPEKALESYNAVLAINPNDIAAVKGSKDASARVSMASGGWETAKDYRDLIKDKEQAVALEQVSRVIKDEDTIDQLLAELSERYAQDQTNLDVVRKIAGLYEQRNDLASALTWLEYAVQLTNRSDPGLLRKVADMQMRRIDHRVRELGEQLADPALPEADRAALAAELEELNVRRAEELIDEARRRVERNPTDLQVRFELGEVLMRAGHYGEAMPELQKAMQSPNVRVRSMGLLGRCMVAKEMYDLAEVQFKKAVSEISGMDETKKDLLYNLALVYEKMGRNDEYIESMKRIYEVDFGYRDVAKRVEDWYQKH